MQRDKLAERRAEAIDDADRREGVVLARRRRTDCDFNKLPDGKLSSRVDREHAICNYVVANEQMLVVSDIEHDPRFADNETIVQWNMRFCAGTRLRAADDLIIGALCVLDSEPRTLGENGVALLEAMAADIACPRRLPVGVGRSVRPTISVRPRMRIANKPVRLAQQAHGLERNMP
ncbi:hypothetical protein XI08_19600 [Bradyrhizobium sp. CCBAU 11361]|nr:hypothetical protein [Bradyrhizobium sp. CCBAU 11361]